MSINSRHTRSATVGAFRLPAAFAGRPALCAAVVLLTAALNFAGQAAGQSPLIPRLDPTPYDVAPGGPPVGDLGYSGAAIPARPVQLTMDPRTPLDPRISAMPRADQKIEVIHHRSQLVVTRGGVRQISISDPNILDIVQFSPTEISLIGMGMGSTDLWLWFDGQPEPLMYVVTVIRDPSWEERRKIDYGRIERKIALMYPNSKVYMLPMTRNVIVRGQAKDSQEAARIMQIVRMEIAYEEGAINGIGDAYGAGGAGGYGYGGGYGAYGDNFGLFNNNFMNTLVIDELDVPGEFQVSVKVRIAEVNRSQLRRMGVDWRAIINEGAADITQTFATGTAPMLQGVFENGNITVLVDLLASNGVAQILDEAQLTVLSGEPAAFLSGGEFAVPTIVGIGGAQGQQTSFRGFGTSIITTPTIIDHDLIRLQIVPELSVVNSSNAVGGIPGVDVRRVQTMVELREGQTIVLGGVFSRRQAAENSRIPFVGEIPVIGSLLFNAKQATEDETELLIVVTPEIVRPMDPDQVPPLPGFNYPHPDDIDFFKYNRIQGNIDPGVYQLLPYGNGQGFGMDVGYQFHNPAPMNNNLAPAVTGGASSNYQPGGYPPGGYSQNGGYPVDPGYQQAPQGYVPGVQPGGINQQMLPPAAGNYAPPVAPTQLGPTTNYRGGNNGQIRQVSGSAPAAGPAPAGNLYPRR